MKYRILIIDDHEITRKGYAYLFGEEMDMEICGEAGSALDGLALIPTAEPDLVITDITLEGMSGLELIKHLNAQYPALPVLVVSMHSESLYAERALRAGARGYLMKREVGRAVVKAVRCILDGGLYVSEQMNKVILRQFAGGRVDEQRPAVDRLSDRELEVLEHLGRGLKTREIAEAMMISPNTVDTFRARIKEKLGLGSGAELLQYAVQYAQDHDLL